MRPAGPADSAALAALDARASRWPWPEYHYRVPCRSENNLAQGCVRVLEEGGELVGAVVYSLILDEGCIQNLITDPGHRRRGLARRLLQAALEVLHEEGASCCLLEVRASNVAALALYRNCGFVEDGRRRGYYPLENGREDAILMSMAL